MKKTPLKIGFDLDGVLLYNPARIFRLATIVAKSILRQKKQTKTEFYYPKTEFEKILWNIVHWSSLYIADGYEIVSAYVRVRTNAQLGGNYRQLLGNQLGFIDGSDLDSSVFNNIPQTMFQEIDKRSGKFLFNRQPYSLTPDSDMNPFVARTNQKFINQSQGLEP